jgi:plastocyanin
MPARSRRDGRYLRARLAQTRVALLVAALVLSYACTAAETVDEPGVGATAGPEATPAGASAGGTVVATPPAAATAAPVARTPDADAPLVPVVISGLSFGPPLRVPAGTRVSWVNEDQFIHDVRASDESWSSPELPEGEAFEHWFDEPGVYAYYCSLHLFMQGEVVVE